MSLVFVTPTVEAQAVRSDGIIELQGDVAYPEELSGVALWSDLIVVCPDEGAQFNVFKHIDLRFELVNKVNLLVESEKEIDMEGAASDAEHVYIVGSHSIRRRRIDEVGSFAPPPGRNSDNFAPPPLTNLQPANDLQQRAWAKFAE